MSLGNAIPILQMRKQDPEKVYTVASGKVWLQNILDNGQEHPLKMYKYYVLILKCT